MDTLIQLTKLSVRSLILIGISVAAVLVVLLVDLPQINKVISSTSDVSQLNQQISEYSTQAVSLNQLSRINLQDRLTVLEDNLPSEFEIAFIISSLKQLANQSQVQLLEASAATSDEPAGSGKKLQTQQINATIFGQPQDMLEFIRRVNNITPILRVKDIDYTQLSVEDETATTKLVIESYYYPNPTTRATGSEIAKTPEIKAPDEQLYESLQNREKFDFIPVDLNTEPDRTSPFKD